MGFRVAVVGAGIGGLTLAHALRWRGIECVVFDRDTGPGDTAGYRLHLTAAAVRVLSRMLPDDSMRALRECGAGAEAFTQFAVLDHRGATRLRLPITHSGEVLMIGRRPLREILARGLERVIHWNTPVHDLHDSPAGTEFDLLVVADGANSRLAGQWIGRPTARHAGVVGIAGRSPLPQRIPADLHRGPAFAIGPRGVGAFFSLHATRSTDPAAEPPALIWSVGVRSPAVNAGGSSQADLIAEVHRLTRDWSADFHTLVDGTEPGSVALFPFFLPAALGPWPPGKVTLLGDAIHPMPPTAGSGAGTAILDAAHLATDLATYPPAEATGVYQRRLLDYAPPAVDESRPSLAWQSRLADPLLFALADRLLLPAAGAAFDLARAASTWRGQR